MPLTKVGTVPQKKASLFLGEETGMLNLRAADQDKASPIGGNEPALAEQLDKHEYEAAL